MNIRKHNQPSPQSSQAGFTIIESLIAIMVVAILLVGLSPVIVLAVANRIQARRVELGTQAARTYIDGVKAGIIGDISAGAGAVTQLPTITKTPLSDVPPPTSGGTLTCDATTHLCNASTDLYCVPGTPGTPCNVNSVTDMVVQAFTYQPNPTTPPDPTQGYVLGVRVYRADAFKESGILKKASDTPNNSPKAQTFTGGLGDRKAPIFETVAEIASSKTTYKVYCDRLQDASNKASNCQ